MNISDIKCKEIVIITFVITVMFISLSEARGGRRGGSFGGLFGSWRKYKKPSSGGVSSRRIVSSSPVHTPITKAWHENKKSSINDKFQKNIKANNNIPPLPMGGAYYQNTAAVPVNAIYVPQGPPRGAEFGDFLTGYLTGRLLTMGFPSPHYHVTHVYRDSPSAVKSDSESNNNIQLSTEKIFNAPLVDFTTNTDPYITREAEGSTTQIPLSTTETTLPPYGVICIPIFINETTSNGEVVQNERTVCYPAPAPPAPQKDMKSKPVEIAGDIMEH